MCRAALETFQEADRDLAFGARREQPRRLAQEIQIQRGLPLQGRTHLGATDPRAQCEAPFAMVLGGAFDRIENAPGFVVPREVPVARGEREQQLRVGMGAFVVDRVRTQSGTLRQIQRA